MKRNDTLIMIALLTGFLFVFLSLGVAGTQQSLKQIQKQPTTPKKEIKPGQLPKKVVKLYKIGIEKFQLTTECRLKLVLKNKGAALNADQLKKSYLKIGENQPISLSKLGGKLREKNGEVAHREAKPLKKETTITAIVTLFNGTKTTKTKTLKPTCPKILRDNISGTNPTQPKKIDKKIISSQADKPKLRKSLPRVKKMGALKIKKAYVKDNKIQVVLKKSDGGKLTKEDLTDVKVEIRYGSNKKTISLQAKRPLFQPSGVSGKEMVVDTGVEVKQKRMVTASIQGKKGSAQWKGHLSPNTTEPSVKKRSTRSPSKSKNSVGGVVDQGDAGMVKYGEQSKNRLPPPKLEVEQFSGDMARWVEEMPVEIFRKLRFRWKNSYAGAFYATVAVNSRDPRGRILQQMKLSELPAPGQWKTFHLSPFQHMLNNPAAIQPNTPVTYFITVKVWKNTDEPLGQPSNPVKITYSKSPQPITQFQLDEVKILNVTPESGSIVGSQADNKVLDDGNSLKIKYFYELQTIEEAEIRQWLLLAGGSLASNNYWTFARVTKGTGQAETKATIRCLTPTQAETHVYGINYILSHEGSALVEDKKMFDKPIIFRCPETPKPDKLKVHSISHPAGATILGAPKNQPFSTDNAIQVTYMFKLNSCESAEVRQWAVNAYGNTLPNNYWTVGPINQKGTGLVKTWLTISCDSLNQPSTQVKGLKIMMIDVVNAKPIVEFTEPVEYTFKCINLKGLKLIEQ